jgi:hypothetical protein
MWAAVRRSVVLVVAVVCASCTGNVGGDDCYTTIERAYTVSLPADAQLQYAVDTCMVDASACPNVCQAILERQQIQTLFPATCDVRFTSNEAKVNMSYEVAKPGCAIPVGDEPGSNF